ncbi:hypothetical protein ACK31Q_01255, partial [Aeromonas caviae]
WIPCLLSRGMAMAQRRCSTIGISYLDPTKELNNVSKAFNFIGHSSQQFYEISHNYQTYGANGWL